MGRARFSHPTGQQIAQGIDGHVHLAVFTAFMAIPPSPVATLGGRLDGAAIQHHSGGMRGFALGHAQQRPQIVYQHLEAAGLEPALALLVDRRPRQQVVGDIAPGRAGAVQRPDPAATLLD